MSAELLNKIRYLEKLIDRLPEQAAKFIPLLTPLTSTSYDGNDTVAISTVTIDTSSVFSAPVGIKAASIYARATWASANTSYVLAIRSTGGGAADNVALLRAQTTFPQDESFIVPCDANGDFDIVVSGANATNVILRIWGYWI